MKTINTVIVIVTVLVGVKDSKSKYIDDERCSDYACARMDFVGRHLLASFTRIEDLEFLNNPNRIREAITVGVQKAQATILGWQVQEFQPQGYTLIALLAESHVSVHTYPEHRALFFDAFTCGEACEPGLIFQELLSAIGQCDYVCDTFKRSEHPCHIISRSSST